MNIDKRQIAVILFAVVGLGAVLMLGKGISETVGEQPTEEKEVRTLVTAFGEKLRFVSLAAEPAILAEQVEEHYKPYISEYLLSIWKTRPELVVGRFTSSPWPERIKILEIVKDEDGSYTVQGDVLEVVNKEGGGTEVVSTYPLAMKIRKEKGRWVITGTEKALPFTEGSS